MESVEEFLARGGKISSVPAGKKAAKAKKPMTLARAIRLYDAAQDFPRHGEGWPATPLEKEADRLARENGYIS